MAKKGNKGGKGKSEGGLLFKPNQMLYGKPFRRVANALTRVETQPAINAQKYQIGAINRGMRRDLAALAAMGNRLDTQAGGMTERLAGYAADSVGVSERNRDALSNRLKANADASQDSINQLQSSVLGGQISSLANQRVDAGGSETMGRFAQIAQMQQNANAANSQAYGNLGAVVGNAAVSNADSQRLSALNNAENQRLAIARNVASRQAETRADASEASRAAQSELATLKGLRGATKLKNLLDLRREQQQYQLGRAELAQAGAQARAELDLKERELDIEQQKANQDGRDGGSDGGDKDDFRLGSGEYSQLAAAAKEYAGGSKITDYTAFLNELGKQEGVNWSAIERRKFRKRFKKKNPGLFG